jgi:SprT-like family
MVLTSFDLRELMELPLPTIYEQKRLIFRPSVRFAHHAYELINYEIFGNNLYKPKLEIQSHCRKYWGMCMGHTHRTVTGSYCTIRIMDKYFCPQWFITTLAHEMVHQYQWDILGPEREKDGKEWLMSHGPTFFDFREHLEYHNISLKTAHSQRRWFKHQDLFKA